MCRPRPHRLKPGWTRDGNEEMNLITELSKQYRNRLMVFDRGTVNMRDEIKSIEPWLYRKFSFILASDIRAQVIGRNLSRQRSCGLT